MEVYLDNSATTRAYECVRDIVGKVMCEDYGNPSSMHKKGVDAEAYVREAKETLAKILKVQEKELYFTSGGTESDNLALIGGARANHRAGKHLITSSIEHPAILNTMRYLEEEEGYRVTYLPVDEYGRIRLDALKEALCDETILVSVMYVNNEVGSVQPIAEASAIVKAYNKNILFLTLHFHKAKALVMANKSSLHDGSVLLGETIFLMILLSAFSSLTATLRLFCLQSFFILSSVSALAGNFAVSSFIIYFSLALGAKLVQHVKKLGKGGGGAHVVYQGHPVISSATSRAELREF